MKIVFVSDAIYPYNKGGKEKRLYELSTRLANMGHDVHIYTMHWWPTHETSRVEDSVTLHALSNYYPLYSGDTRSVKEGILFGLACFKLLRVKFDILDVDHMPFFPILSSWVVCRLRLRRLHATWHEALSYKDWTDYIGAAGVVAYVIERVCIKLPTHITASSISTQKTLLNVHRRTNVSVVTPGVNLKVIKAIKPTKLSCDVLYVGRLVKDKNVDKLVLAIQLLKVTMPSISCTVIGHGIEKDKLFALIAKLKMTKNIKLLEPLKKDTDIYSYMKAAKVLCLPSAREGFGMVVLEALACGTPVVTVDSPANAARYLITDDTSGSIVPLLPASLASAISDWIKPGVGKKVPMRVEQYDWDTITSRQLEIYAS